MRWASVVVVTAVLSSTALSAPRPPGFYRAEQYFNTQLSLRDRITAQILLIGAGLQNSVPSEQLQTATFNAAQSYQATGRSDATGVIDGALIADLFASTGPQFQLWGFEDVPHPWRGRPIWMPQGMGLQPIPNRNGLTFRDPAERVEVHYNFFPGAYIDKSYFDTLADLRRKGAQIRYAVQKDDWYVISSTSAQGFDGYRRYHIDGTGIVGFTLFWNNARGDVHAERIAILMSASLGAVMGGRPFVDPKPFAGRPSAPPQPYRPAEPPPPRIGDTPSGSLDAIQKGAKLRVEGVADNDVLKAREEPGEQGRVVGTIPPEGSDIEFLGDRHGPWLFVRYERFEGWVHSRFVAYEPRRGRKLEDGE